MGTMEQKAIDFAVHAHSGQQYGDDPYTTHLTAVRLVLDRFSVTDESLRVAAWLHDTVEDTAVTRDDVVREFGEDVSALVWAVTGIGPNRKTRNADAYAKIVQIGERAAILKLADRLANVEANQPHTKHREMYRREMPSFEQMILTAGGGNTTVRTMLGQLRITLATEPLP